MENSLKMIVDSIKEQLYPRLQKDKMVSDELIAHFVHMARASIVPSLYAANDKFNGWYQNLSLEANVVNEIIISGHTYKFTKELLKMELPCSLLSGMGYKDIQYLGSFEFGGNQMHRCTLLEFLSLDHSRYTGGPKYYVDDKTVYIKDCEQRYFLMIGCFSDPTLINEDWNAPYPINSTSYLKMQIIIFQHIAEKLGIPIDFISNEHDDTANINLKK